MKTVYLVRHGETEGNVKKFSQVPETELTEKGHNGAKALAQRFSHIKADLLVASPFTRAQQTASYVSEVLSLPITTFESFHEILKPDAMRGKMFNEKTKETFEQYAVDVWQEERRLPGMEHIDDILSRAQNCLEYLEKREEENIVIVSHGDFLRHLISYILLGQQENVLSHEQVYNSFVRLNNVAVTVIEYNKQIEHDQEKWRVKMYNDHSHFAE